MWLLGPVLVSPAEIQDPQTLKIQAIYNGKILQDGHTKDMVFTVRQQISRLSRGTTLEAGTIILTGTPAGIGYFKEPRVFLEEGSQITVYIDGIGSLINNIKYEQVDNMIGTYDVFNSSSNEESKNIP